MHSVEPTPRPAGRASRTRSSGGGLATIHERLRRSVGTRTPPADTASTDYGEPTPKTLMLGPSLCPNPNVGTQSLAYMHVAKTGIAAIPNDPHLDGVMYRLSLHFV